MSVIRDFVYLDIPRLESFASQLFEGLPGEAVKSATSGRESHGEVRGKVPVIVEGAAGTKSSWSASSSVSSRMHHHLVVQVIDGLKEQGYLRDSTATATADDGDFVLVAGTVQLVDPEALAQVVVNLPDLERAASAFDTSATSPPSTRRKGGGSQGSQTGMNTRQAKSIETFVRFFAGNTVRVRILNASTTLWVGVVERDKFVESIDRLVMRHGYVLGGIWHVLAQVNHASAAAPAYRPEGENLLDLVEKAGMEPMRILSSLSGATVGDASITPLAIYREIRPA